MKKVFICDLLNQKPWDEGYKKTAALLVNELSKDKECLVIVQKGSDYNDSRIKQIAMNKLLLSGKLFAEIKSHTPEIIYYFPESSITLASLVRSKILKYSNNRAEIIVVALQLRRYPRWLIPLVKFIKPKLVLVFSSQHEEYLKSMNFAASQIPLGVDTEKFKPVDKVTKTTLRDKYNIPRDKFVLIHVGHFRISRNIDSLLALQSINSFQLVIVGSTSNWRPFAEHEISSKNKLISKGIKVIDWYVDQIEEIYQLADAYIFPLRIETAAISFPLSVLEAMACNLPVITTRFGGLPKYFPETPDFRYYDEDGELFQIIEEIAAVASSNRQKAMIFSWNGVVKKMEIINRSLIKTEN